MSRECSLAVSPKGTKGMRTMNKETSSVKG